RARAGDHRDAHAGGGQARPRRYTVARDPDGVRARNIAALTASTHTIVNANGTKPNTPSSENAPVLTNTPNVPTSCNTAAASATHPVQRASALVPNARAA